MLLSLSVLVCLIPQTVSLTMKTQGYLVSRGKKMAGEVIDSRHVDNPSQCAMLCLSQSCKVFNVIEEENKICQIIGEQQPNLVTDPFANFYGKWFAFRS